MFAMTEIISWNKWIDQYDIDTDFHSIPFSFIDDNLVELVNVRSS